LDYESMKRKWNAEGSSGEVSSGESSDDNANQTGNMVVTPIYENKQHLRQHLRRTISHEGVMGDIADFAVGTTRTGARAVVGATRTGAYAVRGVARGAWRGLRSALHHDGDVDVRHMRDIPIE